MCFGLHSKRIRNMGLRDKRFYVRAQGEGYNGECDGEGGEDQ